MYFFNLFLWTIDHLSILIQITLRPTNSDFPCALRQMENELACQEINCQLSLVQI